MDAITSAGSFPPRSVKETNLDDESYIQISTQNSGAAFGYATVSQDARKYFVPFSEEEANGTQIYGSIQESPQRSTTDKTAELYCNKCHKPVDNFPRVLSSTTLPSYETVDSNYQQPIGAIKTPFRFAQEMLKRLGHNIPLSSLLQYYLNHRASFTATLVTSTAGQAWSSEQYNVAPDLPSCGKLPLVPNKLNAGWNRDAYETDVDEPHAPWNQDLYNTDTNETEADDPRVKIFPCGHVYHYHCATDMKDCSHAATCTKAAELFYHRILVMKFNPDLASSTQADAPHELAISKPSLATRSISNLGRRLWGASSVTNLSDWARFRGRRALVLCVAAATVAVPVCMALLSKASAARSGAEEGSPENTTVAAGMLNATLYSVANTVSTLGLTSITAANIANTTMTALGIINATKLASSIAHAAATAANIINATFALSPVATELTSPTQNFTEGTSAALPTSSQLSLAPSPSSSSEQPPTNGSSSIAASTAILTSPTKALATTLTTHPFGFEAAVNYGVGSYPYGIATGDFNGDGKLDLAVTNFGSATVSVLLGKGDGTFQPVVNYTAGSYPYGIAAADFNGDSKLDLAVANEGSATISVLLGKGDGTFATAVHYAVGPTPYGIAAGDFNGDGKLDLAVVNYVSSTISVLIGKGDGTFETVVNYAVGSGPEGIAAGDFNGDGKLDLAVTNNGASGSVAILLNS